MSFSQRLRGGTVDFDIALERTAILPGRAALGRVSLTPLQDIEARGVVAALIATEHWEYTEHSTDADGSSSSRTVTRREEHRRLAVMLAGPAMFPAGQTSTFELQMPVPPLGPATFQSRVLGMDWELEVKLDVPMLDPSVSVPVIVLQPTALLMAGVVRVGEFALYPSVESGAGDLRCTIALDPMPLCVGAPFSGRVAIPSIGSRDPRSIRAEVLVRAEATVSNGHDETLRLWGAELPSPPRGAPLEQELAGVLAELYAPTIELPHGRADATLRVTLDLPMAPDVTFTRDVAVSSTREV